jgi:hypothetical protein
MIEIVHRLKEKTQSDLSGKSTECVVIKHANSSCQVIAISELPQVIRLLCGFEPLPSQLPEKVVGKRNS